MQIVFDHQIFTMQEYGGISRYFVETAKGLVACPDTQVTVSAPVYVNNYLKESALDIAVTGYSVKKFKGSGIALPPINFFINKGLLKALSPDIVHETYYSFQRSAPKSAKVVLTVFDMIHELFPTYFSQSDTTYKKKASAVARADHIICISCQTQNDLINLLKVDPAKTTVIHLGFALTCQETDKCSQDNRPPYLLYVGARSGYKNFENFLKGVASSSFLREELDVVCFGGNSFSSKEHELIKRLGFRGNSVYQLSGSDAVLAGLYQNARVFVYPSLYEGFGIPPLEAMALGCPVACSNVSSIPEVVGDAGCYFDPTSIEEISAAVERTVTDLSLRNALVSAGRKRIQEFSWERCAAETLAVYQKLQV